MLPKSILIIPLLLVSSVIYGQLLIVLPEKEDLKGKVKSYTELSFEAIERSGKIEKGKKITNNWEYDIQRRYDESGKQIEWNGYKSDGSLYIKYTYKYDENGNIIEESWYDSDGSIKGNRTFNYQYDENGNPVEENLYGPDGSLIQMIIYRYDDYGYEKEEYWFNSDGSLNGKHIYKFDKNGNRIKENYYNSVGTMYSNQVYKYNENGNKIEWNGYTDGILYMTSTYSYDEYGNQVAENRYNSDGSLRMKKTYKYVYDKSTNWIKKIVFEDDIAKTVLEREYEYYK